VFRGLILYVFFLSAGATFALIFVTGFTVIPGNNGSATAAAGFSLLILGKMKSGGKKYNRRCSKY
jgi:hypothetical protein